VFGLDGQPRRFNSPDPKMTGFVATRAGLDGAVREFLAIG
jgi:hypothetical protein